jgi:hypothetical protein
MGRKVVSLSVNFALNRDCDPWHSPGCLLKKFMEMRGNMVGNELPERLESAFGCGDRDYCDPLRVHSFSGRS